MYDLFINILAALLLSGVGFLFGSRRIKIANLDARPFRTPEEKQRHAKKGLILLVSLYTHRTLKLSPEAKQKAVQDNDYKTLDIENSNLGHNIEAVITHQGKLEHCWIVGSCSNRPETFCSMDYEDILVEYLRKEKNINCQFHYGKDYAVSLDEDALVCENTHEIVSEILQEAREKYKLKPTDVIVDVTGGVRSMNLGMVLACLDKDRDIQIIGSQYDQNGNTTGKPYPIKIHFEPKRIK